MYYSEKFYYIVNGLKYRYISLFYWKFWVLLLPENNKK